MFQEKLAIVALMMTVETIATNLWAREKDYNFNLLTEKTRKEHISFEFNLDRYELRATTTPYGPSNIAHFEGGVSIMQKDAPELYKTAKSFIIPNDKEMKLDIINSEYQDFYPIEIAPSKGHLTRDINPQNINRQYGKVYQRNAFFPQQVAKLERPFIFRELRGQTVTLHPLQYNPVTKTLRVYSKMTLTLKEIGPAKINPLQNTNKRIIQRFYQPAQSHFINLEDRDICTNAGANVESYGDICLEDNERGDLLIVTHTKIIKNLFTTEEFNGETFIRWKKRKELTHTSKK